MNLRVGFSSLIAVLAGCMSVKAKSPDSQWAGCDFFTSMVASETKSYHAKNRLYPVPASLQQIAVKMQPQLFVHTDASRPIDFERYLSASSYVSPQGAKTADAREVFKGIPANDGRHCGSWLTGPEVAAGDSAPVYTQVFRDEDPGRTGKSWTWIKYNYVFDWSGLAEERSIFASVGVTLTGGDSEKWHRFDVHTSVILGVDEQQTARTLTIMQHNHQRTWIIGKDLPAELPVKLAVAFRSNEIYPDDGSAAIQRHRVVTSLLDWEYLFDAEKRPWLWAEDLVAGVGMGAQAMQMVPEFPAPDHPLASFPGLLAPPRRILGQYVGRDGPPGYDFYALPEFLAMPDITAMGYWQPGNQSQWLAIKTHLDGFKNSNWAAIRERLRIDLVKALSNDLK